MMSLRLQVSLLVSLVAGIFVVALIALQTMTTRLSVHEEIETARRIANRVVSRVVDLHGPGGVESVHSFLDNLGRLRAIDIQLTDQTGKLVYESPATRYKVGEYAPRWFSSMVAPTSNTTRYPVGNGLVTVTTEPSRAALDGWQQTTRILSILILSVLLLGAIVYLLIGRALRPFQQIINGLRRVESGRYDSRLPLLATREANEIGQSFNRMTESIRNNLDAREQAARAEERLMQSQDLNRQIEEQTERFSLSLARELHDELGQHVTAIKSLALSIWRRSDNTVETPVDKAPVAQAAELITQSADRIHGGMRSMLKRLTPISLEQFGLSDAMQDLISDLQVQHPDTRFGLSISAPTNMLNKSVASAAFRIVQESLTNAIRHAGATRIDTTIQCSDAKLRIEVSDDGNGLHGQPSPNGGLGMRGMQARAQAIGGDVQFQTGTLGGLSVIAELPLVSNPQQDPQEDQKEKPIAGEST